MDVILVFPLARRIVRLSLPVAANGFLGVRSDGLSTALVRAITTLSVLIFLFTPPTTVATITIFQLVNGFNWGGTAAFTVSVIGIAVVVLVIVTLIRGLRVSIGRIAGG